jgi:dTDP-4-dehydrorhamnose 3,5-epimerase
MELVPTSLPEVILIQLDVHRDPRGFFVETFHEAKYRDAGVVGPFVQDNHSMSSRGVLRGLHAQRRFAQGKLIRCTEGAVFDVAVDVRRGSPRFAQWIGYELSAENFRQLWIPPGFVHGFLVLSERAQIEYKCTELYHPEDEYGIVWDDPAIGIEWPVDEPLLSKRDAALPRLCDVPDLPE